MNSMKVYYNDGEIDVYDDVEFEAFDLESIVAPMIGALIFEHKDKQVCILLYTVKKFEFVVEEEG